MIFLSAFLDIFLVQAFVACLLNIHLLVRIPGTFHDFCLRLTLPGIMILERKMGRSKLTHVQESIAHTVFVGVYLISLSLMWW